MPRLGEATLRKRALAKAACLASLKKRQERRLQREREGRRREMGEEEEIDVDIKIEPEEAGAIAEVEDSCLNNNEVEGQLSVGSMKDYYEDDCNNAKPIPPPPPLKFKKMSTPSSQSPSFCFVCANPLTSETRPKKVIQAEYICLLTDLLELPKSQSRQYLQRIGQPEKWIGLCHECLHLIKEVERRKEIIAKMQEDIRSCQHQIVRKLKAMKLNLAVEMGAEGKTYRGKKALQALEKILQSVHRKNYGLDPTSVKSLDSAIKRHRSPSPPKQQIVRKRGRPPKSGQNVTAAEQAHGRGVPKKKTAHSMNITKTTTLAYGSQSFEKSEEGWMDVEQEDPLFTNDEDHEMEEEKVTPADPLALGDEDEEEAAIAKPAQLDEESSYHPQIYYCGLCADDPQTYKSEAQLQLHTNQAHRPTSPPPRSSKIVSGRKKKKKRRRKQNFSVESESEEEYEELEESYFHQKVNHSMETASSLVFQYKPKIQTKSEDNHDIVIKAKPSGQPDYETDDENTEEHEQGGGGEQAAEHLHTREDEAVTESHHRGDEAAEATDDDKREGPEKPKPPGKYDCPNCPDVKNYTASRFAQHLAIHQRRPFQCIICSTFFPSDDQTRMEEHWKQKHSSGTEVGAGPPQEKFKKVALDPGEIWKCEGCIAGFRTEALRDAHEVACYPALNMRLNQSAFTPETLPYSCQICKKPFRNVEEWRLHRVIHHPDVDRLSCLLCGLSFAERTLEGVEIRRDVKMLKHILEAHGHPHKLPMNCQPAGGRIYDECEECGLVFNFVPQSSAHFLQVHGMFQGEKIVSCPILCGTRFTNFARMRSHVHLVHFPVDLVVCDLCGKSFKHARTLVEHKLQKHGILQEGYHPVYDCPVEGCGFRTVLSQSMVLHSQMAHGAARKYGCKTCGKTFSDLGKLKVHLQIHENKEKKPYQCEICGNSFAVRNYLYIHKRLSHENRKFPSTNRKREPKKPSKAKDFKKKTSAESTVAEERPLPVPLHHSVEGVGEQQQQQECPTEQYLPTTTAGSFFSTFN